MPAWNEILSEINKAGKPSACEDVRKKYLRELSAYTERNTIACYSGWLQKKDLDNYGLETGLADTDKTGFMAVIHGLDTKKGLDLVLHTPGGSMGATESIVYYLRSSFGNDIRAIVPHMAMSAGTMIACSCKEIIMGNHSNLGPIDPQLSKFPAHGILEEFARAKKEIRQRPGLSSVWEAILRQYKPTLIGDCEKSVKWSELLASEWLETNMFSGKRNRKSEVRKIVKELGSHAATFSHDRHLHTDKLKGMGLKIMALEDDPPLQEKVLSLHNAYVISFTQTEAYKIIENHKGMAFVQTFTKPDNAPQPKKEE